MKGMAWLRARLLVAFDAGSVSGVTLARGLGGLRLRQLARVPLAAGVLVPSPVERNMLRPEAVEEALRRVVAEVGGEGSPATLVLPDGIARSLVFEAPEGVVPTDYARFRLGAGLPFPASEAIVDVQPLGDRRFLGVALRRAIVASYEAVAEAAGLTCERVDVAPMVALDGLRRAAAGDDSTVDVILGDTAFSLVAWRGGALTVFRNRRRDAGPGEAQRLGAEITRTAMLAGDGLAPRVRVVGPGTLTLVRELRAAGARAEAGWTATGQTLPFEAAELPWLGVALS
jgi:hypothetical protein